MKPLNSEARNKILRLALAGHSPRTISERLGIPESQVKLYYPVNRKNDDFGKVLE